jgi:hypothetical protein
LLHPREKALELPGSVFRHQANAGNWSGAALIGQAQKADASFQTCWGTFPWADSGEQFFLALKLDRRVFYCPTGAICRTKF